MEKIKKKKRNNSYYRRLERRAVERMVRASKEIQGQNLQNSKVLEVNQPVTIINLFYTSCKCQKNTPKEKSLIEQDWREFKIVQPSRRRLQIESLQRTFKTDNKSLIRAIEIGVSKEPLKIPLENKEINQKLENIFY